MRVSRRLKQRLTNVSIVIAIAFASGFILQESDLLGPSPLIPGNLPLSAVANGDANAQFTSGVRPAPPIYGTVALPQ